MSELTLSLLWYLVIGVCVIFYVALDGFDLGVGIMHFFTKKDEERRVFLNAIGPVWDGNEVWLVVFGGRTFRGVSGCLCHSLFRVLQFLHDLSRGAYFSGGGHRVSEQKKIETLAVTWDAIFSMASLVIAFGLGLAIGNLMEGIPLNKNQDFIGSFSMFFRPFPVLIGLFTVSLLMMHGSIYLGYEN